MTMKLDKGYMDLGLKDEEYEKIVEFLGRKPNYLELSIYAVMWSEHCSYKSSRAWLKKLKTDGRFVLQGPGENAGVLDIGDGQALVMKIESHNHPSAVEPYQGAATGIGGIIRDVFAMGARPICNLNSLRFGRLDCPGRAKYLFENVVKGIGDYGNCMGIPTVGGEVYFDSTYEGNPLVNAMSVGLVDKKKIIKSKAFGQGNYIVLIGSSTGRDGIHGATFASDQLDDDSESRRPSVQVGDPFMEKVVMEVCLELLDKNLILGLQDMGAAGITSSTVEMASKGKVGLDIDVSQVPLREPSMQPYEIMISESQERMAALVHPSQFDQVKQVCQRWNINCGRIGTVTGTGLYRIFNGDKLEGQIPVETLTEKAPLYFHQYSRPKYLDNLEPSPSQEQYRDLARERGLEEIFIEMIKSPNICSKKWVWEQYDHMVQTNTVVLPGKDSAVIRIKDKDKAVAFTTDGNGRYCYLDAYQGSMIAVAEAARNLVCSGAVPMGITDCLNFGTPEKPGIFWQFKNCIEGMSEACHVLDIPVISGNVSFYNESYFKAIHPTPVIAMAGLIEDINNIVTMDFKHQGDIIMLLGENGNDMGGSEFEEVFWKLVTGKCPCLDIQFEKKLQQFCLKVAREGLIKSAHDCALGGLAVALAKCSLGGSIGAKINIDKPDGHGLKTLFNESQSRIIISIKDSDLDRVKKRCRQAGIPYQLMGTVGGSKFKINEDIDMEVGEIKALYQEAIASIMAK